MTKTALIYLREQRAANAHTWVAKRWNSIAEHLGGRMASGGARELSRFLTRMATWFSCVDGHVILLVVVRTVSSPDDWPPVLPVEMRGQPTVR